MRQDVASPRAISVADFDADGRPDLGVHADDDVLSVYRGNGDGTFEFAGSFPGGVGPTAAAVGDLDGDRGPDLVVTSEETQDVTVLINQYQPAAFGFELDGVTLSWPDADGAQFYNVYRGSLSALADGDGDGLPDTGYGVCVNDLDDDTSDTFFFDPEVPDPGTGFFYLMSFVDGEGIESGLGTTSAGLPREVLSPCP